MFSYFKNRQTTYFDVFCLNFSVETKIKILFLISYFKYYNETILLYKETIKKLTSVKKKEFSRTNDFIQTRSISFDKGDIIIMRML